MLGEKYVNDECDSYLLVKIIGIGYSEDDDEDDDDDDDYDNIDDEYLRYRSVFHSG